MNYLEIDEKNIQSFDYEKTIVSDKKILGSCELGKAEIQLLNSSNEYSSYKNNWIKTQFGSMYIYDVKPIQEKVNISLSCYDVKYKLDVKYDKKLFEPLFPCSLLVWREAIATYCGIEFADDGNFANANHILNTHPFVEDNLSCRNVIGLIAEAGASAVDTDFNDYFYFILNVDKSDVVNDWLELTTEKENTQPVNVVALGRGDVEDIEIYPNPQPENAKELRINNNYILDPQDTTAETDRRKEVIEPIYNRVNGFKYIPFELRTQDIDNKLELKLGQKIVYQDIYDNEIEAYLMTINYKYLGGDLNNSEAYEIILSAEELSETSSNYSYAGSPSKQITQIGISVDKQNEVIESLVKKTGEFDSSLTQVTQDVDTIKQYAESSYNLVRMVKGNDIIEAPEMQENGLLRLKIDGPINLLYPQTFLPPTNNFYPTGTTLVFENEDGNITKVPVYLNKSLQDNDYFLWEYKLNEDTNAFEIQCQVVKTDGTKEQIVPFEIPTPRGTNKIYFENLSVNFEIDYAIINKLTNEFATKVELNSAITQTSSSIKQEVNANIEGVNKNLKAELELKVDTNKLVSEINAKANVITLTSDNFNLKADGSVEAKAIDIIGGTMNVSAPAQDIIILTDSANNRTTKLDGSFIYFNDKANVGVNGLYIKDEQGHTTYCTLSNLDLRTNDKSVYLTGRDTKGSYSYYKTTDGLEELYLDYNNMQFNNNKNVTVDIDGSTGQIVTTGPIYASNISSDKRLKKNIQNSKDDALNVIKNINVQSFDWKKDNKHVNFGFIAQDMELIDKDYVLKNNDNYYINVLPIVATLTKGIQEQQIIIENLRKEIKELKNSFLIGKE